MDFHPALGDELELRADQLVRLTRNYDDGWVQLLLFALSYCPLINIPRFRRVASASMVHKKASSHEPVCRLALAVMGPKWSSMSPVGGRLSPVPMLGPNGLPMSPEELACLLYRWDHLVSIQMVAL